MMRGKKLGKMVNKIWIKNNNQMDGLPDQANKEPRIPKICSLLNESPNQFLLAT